MRKIIFDFYFTVLAPLFAVAVVSLWNSIRLHREAGWRQDGGANAKTFMAVSAGAILAFIAFVFTPAGFKLSIIWCFWYILALASMLWLFYACRMLWESAEKRSRLYFALWLVGMLFAIAAARHFLDLAVDTKHIACPHCDDSDDDS
jgi:uncharacterized membrane protein YcfT